ncbi:1-(5-phosphoribosyl)-5-[(5-phosphoribosylamino)methylideneamino]imidazole-4-carboxamide isomerase [Paraeggerthella hongkongensis]|uniref:1-(5-phosphoribosyl)-5-[(5- phosphoribosylamino)methylideneamino]imidazole-4- carboxamide isomerase n=1 Tax=Paraeggerthella hominis TaxID=2897351 RepID=UPI001C125FDA|nr:MULTISPECIES: 1-(5-phosphoribosyl)-5-[(5-phosphoribosylamino)methylideneamino]imidazole-4-carboxamide isomerase [Paraeggerthella]MBU5406311.1 1-(5-phosphoribosyl)-5-[(5-phosphoribosylamino)methylideneamino]imidazole-4-carboxamide isomerase [Paraeggerthella hongkongensis]MCD2432993.1 1-(5-phosphoribosyl)-5-[(5-phosphoribosylamino)methylideneamino]imidazole-4-carboxamide isomerase [Paraeggerthella hominis]
MHLLPAIDILGGKAVRLAKGDYSQVTVYNDDPAAQAQLFEEEGASWLHVVDLDGAKSGAPENIAIIERILKKTLLKVEVGGGVRSLDTIARLADAGVSRIVLGTSLVADPSFAEAAIDAYGKLLAAGVDAKGGEVAVSGWREGSGVAAEELARHVSQLGFRHLIYTDIARDGMQTGIEAQAYVRMAQAFGHPVVASGGVAGVADIERLAPVAASIEGVIAGRAIYEGALSVAEGVRACEAATRAAEAAAVQANPCGVALPTKPAIGPDEPHPAPVMPC